MAEVFQLEAHGSHGLKHLEGWCWPCYHRIWASKLGGRCYAGWIALAIRWSI